MYVLFGEAPKGVGTAEGGAAIELLCRRASSGTLAKAGFRDLELQVRRGNRKRGIVVDFDKAMAMN